MKKILLFATLVGITGSLQATTIVPGPAGLIGANTLLGGTAYSWGISIPVPSGQEVTSAEVDFTSVSLNIGDANGTGTMFVDMLNSKKTGLTEVSEGSGISDYWATQFSGANIAHLGTETFSHVGQTLSWSYVFTSSELTALNNYLTDNSGIFNIGIDPDCHYSVGGLQFQYTLGGTTHNNVPDVAATALLLVLGLAGLEVFRRQMVAGKAKV